MSPERVVDYASLGPHAAALAKRRGYRQTDPKPKRGRGVTIGGEDLSDLLTGFEFLADGVGHFRGEVTLEGGVPRNLTQAIGRNLLLWDGVAVREAVVTSVRVDYGQQYGATRVRVDFEGWE